MASAVQIDGGLGEGGGQVVRPAVALSVITGKALKLINIRARRTRPGLQRQHLTAVRAAAELADAQLEGARVGASSLTFQPPQTAAAKNSKEPSTQSRRQLHFKIGTAGSTTLVAQTLVPALLGRREPADVKLEGGTHNMLAPPFDYLHTVYAPLLRRMGFPVQTRLARHGFYPAGGGAIELTVDAPADLKPLQLTARGALRGIQVRALLANLPRHIAERECQTVGDLTRWEDVEFVTEELHHVSGPGNVLLIKLEFEHVTELFCGFGQKGVRAEAVARSAVGEALQYLDSSAPVGPHLADQLLLPLACAHAGSGPSLFHTNECTDHFYTHREVIARFLPVSIAETQLDDGTWAVRVTAS